MMRNSSNLTFKLVNEGCERVNVDDRARLTPFGQEIPDFDANRVKNEAFALSLCALTKLLCSILDNSD
jgi:hypothetical protein